MQEALKAVDLGVAAAGTELKAATKAGQSVVKLELILTGSGTADPKPVLRSLASSHSRKGVKPLLSTSTKAAQADQEVTPSAVGGNLLLAKSPLMQKLAQRAIENEQAALAEGRLTNRNGIAYGFVPNAYVEAEDGVDANGAQEPAAPQVQLKVTCSDVADEEHAFSKVVGNFVANAQQQKAEITKRAYQTQQSVKGLALLLGEPPDSEASALLGSILTLADSFDVAFAKIAECAK